MEKQFKAKEQIDTTGKVGKCPIHGIKSYYASGIYCDECGKKLIEKNLDVCECGAHRYDQMNYCIHCGKKFPD